MYPKGITQHDLSRNRYNVSIPFKREGVSKDNWNDIYIANADTFQFPSNGKVYPKRYNGTLNNDKTPVLFQFPSNGKVYPKRALLERFTPSSREFQFPSNGKVYPKGAFKHSVVLLTAVFQFPSNGKVYPKWRCQVYEYACKQCFNSLQTGRCIQSLTEMKQLWLAT